MIKEKWIVLLSKDVDIGKQVWLGYDVFGRIGSASYWEAFRYDSALQATVALAKVRRDRRWPDARVIGTTVEVENKERLDGMGGHER